MKETKEIRMEKGKPYPLGWTENADGSVNLAAVLERSKECGSFCIPEEAVRPDGWHFGKKTESEKSAA